MKYLIILINRYNIIIGEFMKKVLILTSERTGTGHKSSANAIEKKLKQLNYDAKQINCFEMMGKIGRKMEDKYIDLTTKHPYAWKMSHTWSQWFPNFGVHFPIYEKSKKALLQFLTIRIVLNIKTVLGLLDLIL